jgi:hypothetical protein
VRESLWKLTMEAKLAKSPEHAKPLHEDWEGNLPSLVGLAQADVVFLHPTLEPFGRDLWLTGLYSKAQAGQKMTFPASFGVHLEKPFWDPTLHRFPDRSEPPKQVFPHRLGSCVASKLGVFGHPLAHHSHPLSSRPKRESARRIVCACVQASLR